MHEFIEELHRYHRDKARHLFELECCAEELSEGSAKRSSTRLLRRYFEPFCSPDETAHHAKEELILAELQRTEAPIHRRVNEIAADHQAFDRICTNIWASIIAHPDSPSEIISPIRQFISVYKDHADGEEAIFFPIANNYLKPRNWHEVEKHWQ
jgi:hemerythrin-like domain-containing protein